MNGYSASWTKRAFDLACAVPGLILLSPLFLIVALAILLDDRGPVFFRQQRVGRWGKPFNIYKFRSMVVDAGSLGGQLTVGNDKRVTRVGRLLRETKMDELPQLLNVVPGDMSMVGPRPEVPKYVALYTPEQRAVLQLRPGITDAASIEYRRESELLAGSSDPERTYVEEIMPDKIRLNLEYARRSSLLADFGLVLKTIGRLVSR